MALSANGMGDAMADAMIAIMDPAPDSAGQAKIREGCRAMAAGIVGHITANAVATVTVGTGTAGLQRDPVSPFAATLAPAAPVALTGSIA